MIGLLNFISLLLLHYLMSTIIEHSFFSYPLHSIVVLIGLVFLGYRLSIFILACTILEIGLLLHFTIRAHLGRTDKSLANIGTFLPRAMKITMCIGKLHHFFKGIPKRCHKSSWEKVIPTKRAKLFHNLMHFLKGITSSKTIYFIVTKLWIEITSYLYVRFYLCSLLFII